MIPSALLTFKPIPIVEVTGVRVLRVALTLVALPRPRKVSRSMMWEPSRDKAPPPMVESHCHE